MGNLGMMIIPAAILGSQQTGSTMRMTRTMMLETLRQDYIRTAWSKGLSERIVVTRHAMKNALIPVVTMVGSGIPSLVGGAVIIEQIFNLPGMGRLMMDALQTRDYPIISAVNVIMATIVIANNLLIDLTYGWLDPRIHYK
jgi:peptide/nickel transport system permease protein